METVFIRFKGDERDALRAAARTDEGLKKVLATANETASAQVEAAARARRAQEALYSEYRRLAQEARRGSAEQVEANRLAAQSARKLGVEYGDAGRRVTFFGREIRSAERGAIAGSGAFRGLGRSVAFASTAFLGSVGITSLIRSSVEAAIDLERQAARTRIVFGESAPAMLRWSHTAAESMGLTRSEALKTAAGIGNMLRSLGLAPAEAARMSRSLTQLAGDMAAFNGVPVDKTLAAIRSGLAGMPRPLRQFGVFLDQTRLKAEAVRLGLLKSAVDSERVNEANTRLAIAQAKYNAALREYGPHSTQAASASLAVSAAHRALEKALEGTQGKLNAQQKALAAYSIIMQDTGRQQGFFKTHTDDAGVALHKLHAVVGNLEEELGTALLPTITHLAQHLAEWASSSEHQAEIQHDLKAAIHDVAAVLHALSEVAKTFVPIVREGTKALGGFKNTVELLLAIALARKLSGWASAIQDVGLMAGGRSGTGGAAGKVATLAAGLRGLATLGLITVAIELVIHRKWVGDKIGDIVDRALGIDPNDYGGHEPVDKTLGRPGGAHEPGKMSPSRQRLAERVIELRRKGLTDEQIKRRMMKGHGSDEGYDLLVVQAMSDADAISRSQTRSGTGTAKKQQAIVRTAQSQLGIPYSYGGPSVLGKATDCSGLAQAVMRKNGISIPRTSQEQFQTGTPVKWSDLEPGDLVFFNTHGPSPGHVGIYVGGGQMIHDPHTGDHVRYAGITAQYWRSHYVGARRYVKTAKGGAGGAAGDPGSAADSGAGGSGGGGTRPKGASGDGGLRVGTRPRAGSDPGLAIVPGKLTPEQERVANLIYATAIARGASPKVALAMVAAAYAESRLNPRARGGGLFQINAATNPKVYARFMALLREGYDPTTAAVMAMLATFIGVAKEQPGASPAHIAALAERPSKQAIQRAGYKSVDAFYAQSIGSIFGFGDAGGYGVTDRQKAGGSERQKMLTAVDFILKHLDRVLPEARERLRALATALRAGLEGAVTEQDLQRLSGRFDRLVKLFTRAAQVKLDKQAAARDLKDLMRLYNTLPDDLRAELAPKMAKLRELLSKASTPKDIERLRKSLEEMRSAVDDAMQKVRDRFDKAWGRFKDRVLELFDKGVSGRIAMNIEFGADQLSRAQAQKAVDRARGVIFEIEQAGLDEQERAVKQKAEALLVAETNYQDALLQGDRAMISRRAAELAEAQDQFAGIQTDGLNEQEQQYLDAWKRLLDAQDQLNQAQVADEQKKWEALTGEQRQGLEDMLDEIGAKLAAGKMTVAQARAQIAAEFEKYGIDINSDLSNVLGQPFQDAFVSAIDALTKALEELIKVLDGTKKKVKETGDEAAAAVPKIDAAARAAHGTGPVVDEGDAQGHALGGFIRPRPRLHPYALRHFALGGLVPGRDYGAGDTYPSMLTAGELVLTRAEQANLARQLAAGNEGGGVTWTGDVKVYGHVLTERDLRDLFRDELKRFGRLNAGDVFGGFVNR